MFQLQLAMPSAMYARIFFSLIAFDLIWFKYFSGRATARTPHPVVALLVYLGVAYALSVGTERGDYEKSIAWGASVAVLVWGTFNGAMLNVNRQWTVSQAQQDVLSGVANGSIACVYGAAELPVWYLLVLIAVVYVRHSRQEPDSGFTQARLVSVGPYPIWIHMHDKDHEGQLSYVGGRFVVDIGGGGCQGLSYTDAVLEAIRLHGQNAPQWKVRLASGAPLPDGLTYADIANNETYRRLVATPAM